MAGIDTLQPAGGAQVQKQSSNTSTSKPEIDEDGLACLMHAVTIAKAGSNALTLKILTKRLLEEGWPQETIDMAIAFWSDYVRETPIENYLAIEKERN